MNRILLTFLIIVICLFIIVYNTTCFKNRLEEFAIENFQNDTTLKKFKSGFDFHKNSQSFYNYPELEDVDKRHPLLTYGCVKHSVKDNTIVNFLRSNFHTSVLEFYSISINDINEHILNDINKTNAYIKNLQNIKTNVVEGSVYAIIYQAPYLEFHDKIYKIREDTMINMIPSLNIKSSGNEVGKRQLFTKVILVYSKYKTDEEGNILPNKKGETQFKEFIGNHISRDKLCFVQCNNTNMYDCGCLNRTTNDNNPMYYESKCVTLKNEQIDYGMVYMINKYNMVFEKVMNCSL